MVLIFPSIVSICSGWPRHISPNGLNWKNYTKKYLKGAYTIDPGILQPVVPGSFYFFGSPISVSLKSVSHAFHVI
jgi:hypothetical protein